MIMNKIFNFVFFFLMLLMNAIVLTGNSLTLSFIMIISNIVYLSWLSIKSDEKIFEITGATWLQKKFKNNPVIMEMTKE